MCRLTMSKDNEEQKMKKYFLLIFGLGVLLFPSVLWASSVGIVNADQLNARNMPNASGQIVGQLVKGQALKILDDKQNNGWYQVSLPTGKAAYVKEEFLTLQVPIGMVKEPHLNVRSYPDLVQSKILTQLDKGSKVEILYQVGAFYKMEYNGLSGYVYADYVDVPFKAYIQVEPIHTAQDVFNPEPLNKINAASEQAIKDAIENVSQPLDSMTFSPTYKEPINIALGQAIATYAQQFLGSPYVYGGNDLLTGVDCSGFTQQVCRAFDIQIPRTSKDQSLMGVEVDFLVVQPGDFLFFGSSLEDISHVGIYVGDGQMIHASTPDTGVVISPVKLHASSVPLQTIKRLAF